MTINNLGRAWIVAALSLGVAACEFGGGPGLAGEQLPDGSGSGQPDAAVKRDAGVKKDSPVVKMDAPLKKDAAFFDAHVVDAGSGSAGPTPHLLLTEICLNPDAAAFIEIYNPTNAAIDLTNYYLAPVGAYWQLPVSTKGNTPLPLTSGQWIAQFPAASKIAAGQVITVAPEAAADFNGTYGVNPTYSILDGTITDLQDGGSVYLDYNGAPIALFYWDGVSDLVKDVDIMIAGGSTSSWTYLSKSGMTQGSGTYQTDADTIAVQAGTPGANTSTKRILFETGNEIQTGMNNGLTGHDETSENTAVTWDNTFGAPTPGTIPPL